MMPPENDGSVLEGGTLRKKGKIAEKLSLLATSPLSLGFNQTLLPNKAFGKEPQFF